MPFQTLHAALLHAALLHIGQNLRPPSEQPAVVRDRRRHVLGRADVDSVQLSETEGKQPPKLGALFKA